MSLLTEVLSQHFPAITSLLATLQTSRDSKRVEKKIDEVLANTNDIKSNIICYESDGIDLVLSRKKQMFQFCVLDLKNRYNLSKLNDDQIDYIHNYLISILGTDFFVNSNVLYTLISDLKLPNKTPTEVVYEHWDNLIRSPA